MSVDLIEKLIAPTVFHIRLTIFTPKKI